MFSRFVKDLPGWVMSSAPVTNDETFDPREHFRAWRKIGGDHVMLKPAHRATILSALSEIAGMSVAARANALNHTGLRSFTGRLWEGDNLRKFL